MDTHLKAFRNWDDASTAGEDYASGTVIVDRHPMPHNLLRDGVAYSAWHCNGRTFTEYHFHEDAEAYDNACPLVHAGLLTAQQVIDEYDAWGAEDTF